MSKAFNYVDYDIRLEKLETYGVKSNTLDLIKFYFKNRSQIMSIMKVCPNKKHVLDYKSRTQKVINEVPQDCVLGPLLILYLYK